MDRSGQEGPHARVESNDGDGFDQLDDEFFTLRFTLYDGRGKPGAGSSHSFY
jgi:hypothetical protein